MRREAATLLLALCLVVTALGCSVDELLGSGAQDTSGDGGTLPDGGRRRDGGSGDNDGGDEDWALSPGFEVPGDAGLQRAQ